MSTASDYRPDGAAGATLLALAAFVNKASKQRMEKYLFEQKFGIEDGDTQMKNASKGSIRLRAQNTKID